MWRPTISRRRFNCWPTASSSGIRLADVGASSSANARWRRWPLTEPPAVSKKRSRPTVTVVALQRRPDSKGDVQAQRNRADRRRALAVDTERGVGGLRLARLVLRWRY